MARTLDPVAYAVRRDAFVDAAQELIVTRGYERMSIQDVLDRADASRGAFYHYFDSKEGLLTAVIDRMAEAAIATLQPMVDDPGLTAAEKFERLFAGIAQWKHDRKDLVLAVLDIWRSDDNAIVRERYRRDVIVRVVPLLTDIIRQGMAEGTFEVASAEDTARMLVMVIAGMGDLAGDLFVGRRDGTVTFEEVERTFQSYRQSADRLLGASPGTLTFVSDDTLNEWFG